MNKVLKYSLHSALLVGLVSILVFTGCSDIIYDKELSDDDLTTVDLFLATSESQTVVRANVEGTEDENKINSLTLLTFQQDGSFIEKKEILGSSEVVEQNKKYRYKTKVSAGNDYIFVVVANWTVPDSFSGKLSDLKKLPLNSSEPSGLPTSPFVMYGETEVSNITPTSSVEVKIARRVFAVEITSTAPDFTLEDEWYLFNAEGRGYLDADPSTILNFESTLLKSAPLTKDQRAYSYRRNNDSVEKAKETFAVFKGTYNGITSYYRVALNKIGTKQELSPNKLYRLKVVKVIGVGYNTLEDAKKADANKSVVFTVSDWDDNHSETVFYDQYYIKADRVFFEFDAHLQQASTVVSTNAPDLEIIPPVDRAKAEGSPKEYVAADWGTFSIVNSFNQTPGEYMLNVGCYGNLERNARSSFGYVRAKGIHTDDLKLRIDVLQRTDEYYHGDALNIKVSPQEFYSSSERAPEVFYSNVTVPLTRQAWGIRDIQYFIPELGKYLSVGDPEFVNYKNDYEFINSVSTPEGQSWAWKGDIDQSVVWSIGSGKLKITSKDGMTKQPRQARIQLQTGRDKFLSAWIDVRQDFKGDYKLIYPAGLNKDMKRERYVIETPMTQKGPLEYTISITSNCSWDVVVDESIKEWVSITANQTYEHPGTEGFGSSEETKEVKVRVKENSFAPYLDNNSNVYRIPSARSGKITIRYRGKKKNSAGEYVLRLNEQVIEVYQGGSVKIGDTEWMDRNLKSGWKFSAASGGYNNYYFPLLYSYANPIGLPTNVYGAYAFNNNVMGSVRAGNRLGDDGYFISGAPQSGYDLYYTIKNQVVYRRWNGNSYTDYLADYQYFNYPNSGAVTDTLYWIDDFNPCPPGWRVPYNNEFKELISYMSKSVTYGQPIIFPYKNYPLSSVGGEMGVKNSGRMAYIETNNGMVPFFLPAADARHLNDATISFAGSIGYYKQGDRLPLGADDAFNRQTNYALAVTPGSLVMTSLNNREAASVRCVRKKR